LAKYCHIYIKIQIAKLNRFKLNYIKLLLAFLFVQTNSIANSFIEKDTIPNEVHLKDIQGVDLTDILHRIMHKKQFLINVDSNQVKKYNYSIVPAAGYTLQTGFAGIVSGNLGFYEYETKDAKISNITSSLTYSEYSQIILPLTANIWFKNGKYNFVSDNRFISYPSNIYGLGGRTDPNKARTINFTGLKLHNKIVKTISKNWYAGLGLYYDQFWDITVLDPTTKRISTLIQKELGKSETAVGPILNLLYDSRLNQINPENGTYFNLVYRDNFKNLGSDDNWQSVTIDARKYFPFPSGSKNVIALWSLEWLTLSGKIPYLNMPSTGWDDQYNSGRGYIQSRFRGRNMYYLESEYRFGITQNGLIGGVVFANVQSYSGDLSVTYNTLLPGYGAGIRIKVNEHSRTNIGLDYGFGKNGSGGFYVNLGEVF
jgi:hypothetical protein